jgi:hypothetical protein
MEILYCALKFALLLHLHLFPCSVLDIIANKENMSRMVAQFLLTRCNSIYCKVKIILKKWKSIHEQQHSGKRELIINEQFVENDH